MPRFVAFLRAINVGGRNVTMSALRGHFAEMSFTEINTVIASGNVLFSTRARKVEALETRIEEHLKSALNFEVATFIRTIEELEAILEYEPFSASRISEASAFSVGFVKEPLSDSQRDSLDSLRNETDDFHAQGREAYWLCQAKQSESKFSNAVFERTLKLQSTWRTPRTIERVVRS